MKNDLMVELQNISFSYPNREYVLRNLNLSIHRGERVGIVGPNGSGKTTMLLIMVGLLKPTVGHVRLFGSECKTEKDFREARKRIGFLFQNSDDQLFCPTVEEDIAFGPINLGKSRDEAMAIVDALTDQLGISHLKGKLSHNLSEGEKRIVAFATALSMEPQLLILDEPTTALDPVNRERMERYLAACDMTLCIVSHDEEFLARLTDTTYQMPDASALRAAR